MRAGPKIKRTADSMRRRIIRGQWPPGTALPTLVELETQFSVSNLTLQRALGRLKEQNFIITKPRQWMAVAPRPPHLNRYGLLLGFHERHNRFYQALLGMAAELAEQTGKEFAVFRNLSYKDYAPAEWERLRVELEEHCLAGLFCVGNPEQIPEIDWLRCRDLPQVSFADSGFANGARIELGCEDLLRRGIAWFNQQDRRRVAFLTSGDDCALNGPFQLFRGLVDDSGLHCPPAWRLPLGADPNLATPVVELLMSLPPEARPNGLFLADDHLIETVARGLVQARVRVPEDVAVLSHCNWGIPSPCPLDICRLGFDTMAILRGAVGLIDSLIAGEEPASRTVRIPPLFAGELPDAAPPDPRLAAAALIEPPAYAGSLNP